MRYLPIFLSLTLLLLNISNAAAARKPCSGELSSERHGDSVGFVRGTGQEIKIGDILSPANINSYTLVQLQAWKVRIRVVSYETTVETYPKGSELSWSRKTTRMTYDGTVESEAVYEEASFRVSGDLGPRRFDLNRIDSIEILSGKRK